MYMMHMVCTNVLPQLLFFISIPNMACFQQCSKWHKVFVSAGGRDMTVIVLCLN